LAWVAALAAGGDLARAQQPDQPDQTGPSPGPPPATPPPPGGGPPSAAPSAPPVIVAPPAVNAATPPDAEAPPPSSTAPPPETPALKPDTNTAPPAPPPGPPPPVRSPIAILQVLDKVTAETLKFEAPVGRRIRYKTLVFQVRVCETRGPDDPQPRASAYVVVDSEAPVLPGSAAPPTKEVYRGWMFASGPGLHPLEHPVYDAWLVACSAAAPVSPAPAAQKSPPA
jgi:hypothetical protein